MVLSLFKSLMRVTDNHLVNVKDSLNAFWKIEILKKVSLLMLIPLSVVLMLQRKLKGNVGIVF